MLLAVFTIEVSANFYQIEKKYIDTDYIINTIPKQTVTSCVLKCSDNADCQQAGLGTHPRKVLTMKCYLLNFKKMLSVNEEERKEKLMFLLPRVGFISFFLVTYILYILIHI